jgi:hypothetical protein
MTLQAGGSVGIGVAPDSFFHVFKNGLGGIRIGYNGTSVNYYDADTHNFRNHLGTAMFSLIAPNYANFSFNASNYGAPANQVAGIIINNANVSAQTCVEFQVNGTIAGRIRSDYVNNLNHVTGTGGSHYFYTGGDSGTGALQMVIAATGVVTMGHYGAGTATFSAAGVISAVSDERLKKGIKRYSGGIDALKRIVPIRYKWTEESGIDPGMDVEYIGFSSQNVQKSIPEAIGQGADGYFTFTERPIVAALVNAVKELQQQIDELKAPRVRWYTSCIRRFLNGFQ